MSDSVFEYLGSHSLLTLATSSKGGIPHAAPTFYANDGTQLYFSVAPDSVTAQNLAENPLAAVGVADSTDDWSSARGVQIAGSVEPVNGAEAQRAAELFKSRYPFIGAGADSTPYYRLDPHDVRFVDNSGAGDEQSQALGVAWKRDVVHRVFRHLRPDELRELTSRLSTESVKAGETLIEEGTEGDRFYVIVDGAVETVKGGEVLSTQGPGSFVGEIAILKGGARTATVRTTTDTTVVSLSKSDLEKAVADNPELKREFEDVMKSRLARG